MTKSIRFAGLLMTASFAMGCSILPDPAPADVIYRMGEIPLAVKASPDAFIIRVDRPSASAIFQTRDIIVSPDGQRVASAAQAQWAETMPILIQAAFMDVLASRPNLVGVMPVSGARTDTRIQLNVKHFEAQFDQGPKAAPLAIVAFSVTFSNASNRNLLGTYDVRKEYRASTASVSAIVNAISKANSEALGDIATWLEGQPGHKPR